jgi:hypothetical protein
MVLLMATLLVALSFRYDFGQRVFTVVFNNPLFICSSQGWRKTSL